jgi:hypothetical protein
LLESLEAVDHFATQGSNLPSANQEVASFAFWWHDLCDGVAQGSDLSDDVFGTIKDVWLGRHTGVAASKHVPSLGDSGKAQAPHGEPPLNSVTEER